MVVGAFVPSYVEAESVRSQPNRVAGRPRADFVERVVRVEGDAGATRVDVAVEVDVIAAAVRHEDLAWRLGRRRDAQMTAVAKMMADRLRFEGHALEGRRCDGDEF